MSDNFYCGLILITGILLFGCQNSRSHEQELNHLSKTQLLLNDLGNKYKVEYILADSRQLKTHVTNKYKQLLQSLLMDSLKQQIDSIRVTVDTVILKRLTITTRSHCYNIEFFYDLTFSDTTDLKQQTLYNFMAHLKKGKDITVNFFYMGSSRVNEPDSKSMYIFSVFGFPKPLSL